MGDFYSLTEDGNRNILLTLRLHPPSFSSAPLFPVTQLRALCSRLLAIPANNHFLEARSRPKDTPRTNTLLLLSVTDLRPVKADSRCFSASPDLPSHAAKARGAPCQRSRLSCPEVNPLVYLKGMAGWKQHRTPRVEQMPGQWLSLKEVLTLAGGVVCG